MWVRRPPTGPCMTDCPCSSLLAPSALYTPASLQPLEDTRHTLTTVPLLLLCLLHGTIPSEAHMAEELQPPSHVPCLFLSSCLTALAPWM